MSPHTPGPWTIDEFFRKGGFYKIRAKNSALCHVHSFAASGKKDAEASANARLIAKAPEMWQAILDLRAAVATLMDEMGTGPAAKWGVINDALVSSSVLLREIGGD